MGTILKEGEQILVSRKITEEIGGFYRGYTVLIDIDIDIDKLTYAHDDTQHFLTYEVTEDLELPFDNSRWQDFNIKNVRFHAYTNNFKNLILIEHDGCCFDYFDEINEFFEKKKKEKENMILKKGNYIYISTSTWHFSDPTLLTALLGYYYTDVAATENLSATSDDHLLWSRTKFTMDIDFKAIDALSRLHNLNSELDFVRVSKGDVIIYRDVNNERIRIFEAYKKYSKYDTEEEKKNMLNNNTFSISNNSAWNSIDDVIFADNRAYMAATQSVPDKLPDITLEDLRIESSVRTEPLIRGTFMVGPGIIRQPSKFQFTQYAGYKYLFDGGYINGKKPPLKFKLIFGQEHATGRYKTICLWEDGEKTIIHGDNKVTKLPVAQAFAWCYVKRTFGTVSHFKKHVDKRTTKMDGVWYFEGDCVMDDYAQGSVPGTSKKRDIYDAAALAIVTKRYGGLRKLVDGYINKEDE